MKRKLQVFVSSTYEDLKVERQSAVSAILKASHIPAGMELFTSGDKSQMETIRRWIDESDIYMLILGGRYGSIESTSGVSYTELEYDYALEQGKALFSVVIKEDALEDKVKEFGSKVLEQDNPKQLKMFREKVLSNISSFFEDSKDIKLCVYESLSDFATNRDLKGWVSAEEITKIQPLIDEISRISKENIVLKEKIKETQKKVTTSPGTSTSDQEFEELIEILKNIEINIPDNVSGQENAKNTLFNIFDTVKEPIITGVTNQATNHDTVSYLYHNICPKLQVHGLVLNEKVTGVRYRRFAITKKGTNFLAYIERKNILSKK